MAFAPGHLAEHPLPPGITGALGLSGYQLLVEVDGVGAGRLGSQAFLLMAPDADPAVPQAGTQIALHQSRVGGDAEVQAFVALAAELGYLRLSGYRLVPERHGLRSKVSLLDPSTGAVPLTVPEKHPGRLFGGGATAPRLLAAVRSLPAAGPPPDTQSPELLRGVLLAIALRDHETTGAQAAELADRALELARGDRALDPVAAIEAAKQQ